MKIELKKQVEIRVVNLKNMHDICDIFEKNKFKSQLSVCEFFSLKYDNIHGVTIK